MQTNLTRWQFHRQLLAVALRRSFDVSLPVGGTLGIIGALIVNYAPGTKAAVGALGWQIPLGIAIAVGLSRVFIAPWLWYEQWNRAELRAELKEEELRDEIEQLKDGNARSEKDLDRVKTESAEEIARLKVQFVEAEERSSREMKELEERSLRELKELEERSSREVKELEEDRARTQESLQVQIAGLEQDKVSLKKMADDLWPNQEAFEAAVETVAELAETVIRIQRELPSKQGFMNTFSRLSLEGQLSTAVQQRESAANLLRIQTQVAGRLFEERVQPLLSSIDTANQPGLMLSQARDLMTALNAARPA